MNKLDVACAKMDQAEGPYQMSGRITGDDRSGWFWEHPVTRRKTGPFNKAQRAEQDCRSNGYQPKY